ncbi:DUF2789 domain-containing protein [Pseudomonas sp. TMP25]|uniref:DUF2789 domain-containing protein n=1 Tax=Pseudomonas sp. TMP25 TaxID=3136561 RepID=UPI0031017452
MHAQTHDLPALFKQLGLNHDSAAIARFIQQHSPLAADCRLADATFWNRAQATFLREEILEDADWAEIVDQLNLALRG